MSLPHLQHKIVVIIGAVLAYGLVVFASYTLFSHAPTPTSRFLTSKFPTATPSPTPTPDPLAPFNILLLGYAGPHHDGGNLSDTLIVSHIRPREKKVILISLPRDLWVTLPVNQSATESMKINAAFAIGNDDRHYPDKTAEFTGANGGFHLTQYAVHEVTGLQIVNAVAVNFQGFEDIINLFGGITVSIPYTFDDPYYPITGKETDTCGKPPEEVAAVTATLSGETLEHQFPCRYETLHFDKGKQTMDAQTTLKFVRSRHALGGGGDFGRSLRQQALLAAVKSQVLQVSTIPKLLSLWTAIMKNVRTDITIDRVTSWLATFPDLAGYEVTSITLNQKDLIKESVSANGQYILVPVAGTTDFTPIHQYLDDYLNGQKTATPSATRTP